MLPMCPDLAACPTLAAHPTLGVPSALRAFPALGVPSALRAILLLECAQSSSRCLSSLLLVLDQPRSQSLHLSDQAHSLIGASSLSDCRGVLARLHCLLSGGEDCCLATVWSKCCWHWQSKSLMVVNTGTSEGTSGCIGMLAAALACLAQFSTSLRLAPYYNRLALPLQNWVAAMPAWRQRPFRLSAIPPPILLCQRTPHPSRGWSCLNHSNTLVLEVEGPWPV